MEHKKFSNMYIFHVQTFWLSGFRDKWFYISHAYVYIIIFYKHSIIWHSQVWRIDLNRLIDFTSVTKQAICRASRRTSESICTVRLFPLFQVVSSGKGSKIRKQTLECCVCREGMQAWAVPLEKGLLGGLVLGGVWKVGAQALSTIFTRGKPYSEALLTVPKLPMLWFLLTIWLFC